MYMIYIESVTMYDLFISVPFDSVSWCYLLLLTTAYLSTSCDACVQA